MFSSFFGGRKGKKGRGGDAPVISGPLGAEGGGDGVLQTGGAQGNRRGRSKSRSDGAHAETLEGVIRAQKRRARGCQRLAEKAEALRDSSDDADTVAEQEGIRKAQIDLWIVLTAQINVLERVAAETDIYGTGNTGLSEDLDEAELRQAREEEEYARAQDALRAQQDETEQTNYLISRSTEMDAPLDDDAAQEQIDEFTANEFLPARHDS